MPTNIRDLIVETIQSHMETGMPEAEAIDVCAVHLRRMKESLKDDFFEQFLRNAISAAWGTEINRTRREIRQNILEKGNRGQVARDAQSAIAPAPETPGPGEGQERVDAHGAIALPRDTEQPPGRGHLMPDAHPPVAPPSENDDLGRGHWDHDAHTGNAPPGVVPPSTSQWRQQVREMDRQESEQRSTLSILDYPVYVPGLGHLTLRDGMTRRQARAVANYHRSFHLAHGKWFTIWLEIAGDWKPGQRSSQQANESDGDMQVLEYLTAEQIEEIYNRQGRPPMVPVAEE